MSSKKKDLSTAMKRTSDWISSQEIPSDVTINAAGTSFQLHKFLLVSKCGYIRKLVSKSIDPALSTIEIPDIPGGAEAFELAAKFCYGINFEIGIENIAMLRCVAEYLEMTEDYASANLVETTEGYLNEVALKSLTGAISVLHVSENFLSIAEQVKLVGRCIDSVAYLACIDSQSGVSGRAEEGLVSSNRLIVNWWAEDLTVLRIDIFQRVAIAMMARGFKQDFLGPILMLYVQKSLRGLELFGKGRKKIEAQQEYEKRVVLETIVSLLPREKHAMSVSFLAMLLRSAIYLNTTFACRLDLEKRMGMQLGHAVLEDLLIPSYFFTGDTLFDVDTAQRIMMNYLEYEMDGKQYGCNAEDEHVPHSPSDIKRVGKLMENYLAEIASDRNLIVSRFISIAELIPQQSRITEDGIYRAIDIYLKAHPDLSDMERKKVCSLMDCHKLSREACAHAAQNDRLPVQTVVQVLYYEQQRLRDVMVEEEEPSIPQKLNSYSTGMNSEISSLRRENEDLKMELVKLKLRLKEIERSSAKPAANTIPSHSITPSADKPPLPRKSLINSMSKKLGRMMRGDGVSPSGGKASTKPAKNWRHSIS